MPSGRSRANDLEMEIVQAFQHVAYPQDCIIAGDFGEYVEAQRELGTLRWQDLQATKIQELDWILPFLTPLGFHYYLPAFLLYTVQNVTNPDLSCDATINSLCVREGFSERLHLFTRPQRLAVKHFLEFIRDASPDEYEEPCEALAAPGITGPE